MGKIKICPRCQGSGFIGENLCQACNPSGAIGDRIVGAGQRLVDRATGRSMRITGGGVVSTRRGRTTVTALPDGMLPPGKRAAALSCDRCHQTTRPLKITSRGAVCLAGCTPTPRKAA
ncbi:hypothetical protein [Frankia sp. BMG5.23]|uniref:hypothetical protein n=1 Tax=Frankia sp. BMG5.23 TaxID=683305 RepID=UPI000461487A|nr:hypothetical protein [Frankia sp. BMG5.23]KDA44967.1 hypothetical protein BMG523Draft_00092 [Frankia sp. BMG5.23]